MKLRVYDFENQCIGYGDYLGDKTTYLLDLGGDMLYSKENPEDDFTDAELLSFQGYPKAIVYKYTNNPKIRMDDGRIFYGTQVSFDIVAYDN